LIRQIVQTQALRGPDAPAILAPGLAPLSYSGLDATLHQLTATLAGFCLMPNDRIALVCSNRPEMVVAFLAIAGYAACAPVNPDYRASEFDLLHSLLLFRFGGVLDGRDGNCVWSSGD
jgi:oxalate---CoA ligase